MTENTANKVSKIYWGIRKYNRANTAGTFLVWGSDFVLSDAAYNKDHSVSLCGSPSKFQEWVVLIGGCITLNRNTGLRGTVISYRGPVIWSWASYMAEKRVRDKKDRLPRTSKNRPRRASVYRVTPLQEKRQGDIKQHVQETLQAMT